MPLPLARLSGRGDARQQAGGGMATPPPPPSASGAGGQPGSVEALASLLGIPLGGGVLHIDSLYVACECRDCDARVRLGHDRPIFGLSRWEKHCGSKAKKWRISLRVVPGSCPEVKLNDPPMAVGTWLDLKGIHVTGTGERIGMDVEVPFAGIAAKRARLPSWAGEGAFEQAGGMEAGGSPGGAAAAAAAAAADASVAQEPLELALLDSAAPEGSMSEAFLRQQQRVFAELRAGSSDGNAAQRQHVAIFGLAAALLEGPAQHLLSEAYLPYINDLSGEHLARQTSTFGCYLDLLGQGMEWQAVHRQLMAFMRGTLRRILSRRPQTSGPAAEGEDGAAAEGAKPSASSPARPTTGPSAAAADQERDLPASGSTPGMGEGAADAGEQAPVDSSSRGTGSVEAGRQEQQPAAAAVKQESTEPAV
ncbi:Mitochondrial import receptor subunit TOM40-1 [Chlorella sorokiniana]|uniref:Mitochondrial import receptor subunit TOM40-1 n=1 Tax=Chlorella sorokiniana TaxID=3076 RepID=A0A2P6TYD8_CHLSO|nr:Mitochondrial import receptor subunit TOM40-1 [Chlorella sorokiniana]|eukprot:PRW59071.1 Mitochondrial import receptor subunit TOM40-1 [Chlorella sorokiniana]